ncbi:hypothetical protein ACQ4M3_38965 [Leptolyngbya sp. AN03gr2]|uniref:hypothetical protein n=1 Tax=unclassified Leptolyngbya TaxID=2650499 RepID=UPI003D3203A9
MSHSTVHLGNADSLRACRGRVIILSLFLERDWDKESSLWLMHSTLQLAEATAQLARIEVEATEHFRGLPRSNHDEIPDSLNCLKQQVISLVHQLAIGLNPNELEELQPDRVATVLHLAYIAAVLAYRQTMIFYQE